jgi:serine-type D-Ala-D-Ala carboxypeptidase (penicillin-binding protein 5/6)
VSEESPAPFIVAPFRLDSLHEPAAAAPTPPSRERRRHAHRSHRRRRRRWWILLVAVAVLLAAAGAFVGVRLSRPDPAPTVTAALPRSVSVPAAAVSLPWPATGQGAVAVPAVGMDVASGPEQPVSVASLTKLMTAYVVLHDHPLAPGQPGPTITVTQADVNDYELDTVSDNSNAMVAVGEQLTEEQVLGGMLVHSADNFADLLARWDAGSIPAFVAKMNATAARLGMTKSHFADPSGVDPGSQSTASDLLKVAAPDMADPTFAAMVKMSAVTLPLAGTISTYTPLLGLAGVIGVKSGFTTAAGGCDVLGVERTVHGRSVLLLAAVTGQEGPDVLALAGLHGLALVNALGPLIGSTPVLAPHSVVAHVTEAGTAVAASTAASVSMLTWPGVTVSRVFRPVHDLTDAARRGDRVGTVVVTLGGQRDAVPVRLDRDVPHPSLVQKVFGSA